MRGLGQRVESREDMAFDGPRGAAGPVASGAFAMILLGILAVPATAQFRTLDMQSAVSRASADLQFSFAQAGNDGLDFFRTDLYTEISNGQVGVYIGIPISKGLDAPKDSTDMGNLEVGFVAQIGREDTGLEEELDFVEALDLIYHIGITIPTASKRNDFNDFNGTLATVIAGSTGGLASTQPSTTSINVGVSPRIGDGIFFARADMALDFVITQFGEGGGGLLYKLGAGVGAEVGPAVFTAEVVHTDIAHGLSTSPFEDLQTFTLGAAVDVGSAQPFLYWRAPFDKVDEVSTLGFGVSYQF